MRASPATELGANVVGMDLPRLPLFWRIFAVNASLFVVIAMLLIVSPLLVSLVTELTVKHQNHEWLLHGRYTPTVGAYSLDVHKALVQAVRDKDVVMVYEATTQHYHDYPVLQR